MHADRDPWSSRLITGFRDSQENETVSKRVRAKGRKNGIFLTSLKRKSAIIQYNGQVDPNRILVLSPLIRANATLSGLLFLEDEFWFYFFFFSPPNFSVLQMWKLPGSREGKIQNWGLILKAFWERSFVLCEFHFFPCSATNPKKGIPRRIMK